LVHTPFNFRWTNNAIQETTTNERFTARIQVDVYLGEQVTDSHRLMNMTLTAQQQNQVTMYSTLFYFVNIWTFLLKQTNGFL